eukprot:17741-Heterococcus_DN1.PRE.1
MTHLRAALVAIVAHTTAANECTRRALQLRNRLHNRCCAFHSAVHDASFFCLIPSDTAQQQCSASAHHAEIMHQPDSSQQLHCSASW